MAGFFSFKAGTHAIHRNNPGAAPQARIQSFRSRLPPLTPIERRRLRLSEMDLDAQVAREAAPALRLTATLVAQPGLAGQTPRCLLRVGGLRFDPTQFHLSWRPQDPLGKSL